MMTSNKFKFAAILAILAISRSASAGSYPYAKIDLSAGSSAASFPFQKSEYYGSADFAPKSSLIYFRLCKAGTDPLNRYSISSDMYVGVFEVTGGQWAKVMGSASTSDYYPVANVSFNQLRGSTLGAKWPASNSVDADSFFGVLRAKTGVVELDLPTNAQWEYAARGGVTYDCYPSDSKLTYVGWYYNNSDGGVHEVGKKEGNNFGLYDVLGNVREMTLDWYGSNPLSGVDPVGDATGGSRCYRGGGYYDEYDNCKFSVIGSIAPTAADRYTGFRIFLKITPKAVKYDLGTKGTRTGGGELSQTVMLGAAAEPPTVATGLGAKFVGWDSDSDFIISNTTIHAVYAARELSVTNINARQRYPWNGKVDVDFDLTGDADRVYAVRLEATDLVGNTNLTVSTMTGETIVYPGAHRLTWDAGSDIADDVDLSKVSFTIKATGPVLIAPQNVKENSRWFDCFDLVWDPVPGAASYEVYNSGRSKTVGGATKFAELYRTDCSDYNGTSERPGPRENIWIRAKDKDGNVGPFAGPFEMGNAPT